MGSSISLLLLLFLSIFLLSLPSPAHGVVPAKPRFNIFTYLADYPQYSQFLELLNRTQLAQDMSTRKEITVLVVRNENLGDVIPRQKLDVLQPMLCAHVLMEFLDSASLTLGNMKFPHNVWTVFQTTGVAVGDQGQVRIYRGSNAFMIGSGVKGVRPTVRIIKMVRSDHLSHSVFEVSGVIITPGISDDILPPPAAPEEEPAAKNATEPAAEDTDAAESPADSPAETPADSPPAESPADSPADDTESVADKDHDKPVEEADDTAPTPSSAGRLMFGLFGSAFIGSILAAAVGSL